MRGRTVVRQNDFAFGELSPEHAAAGDRDAVSRSLQRARNVRILNSFSIKNRFGSKQLAKLTQEPVLTTLHTSGAFQWIGVLRPGGMDVYGATGAKVHSIEGAPWTTLDEVKAAVRQSRVDELYVSHQSYPTQVFTRNPNTGAWSRADFAFQDGHGGSLLQPYYRFAAKGITMQPSAVSGTVNLVFSDDVLQAGHVGVIFRYGVVDGTGQELQIATVTDAKHGTAEVLNTLPPTVQVTVADASGFLLGEEVKGLDTQASGFVTNISGNDITVLMTHGYEGFSDDTIDIDHDGNPDSGEKLVGEFTRSYIAFNTQTVVSPAATVAWDEAVVSPVRGYPGAVFERSGRLGFTNFPSVPAGLALSAPDAPTDFDIGTGTAGDALFVILSEGGQTIMRAVSAASLLILTDQAAYYVPEGADVPLSFQTFTVIKIGPAGASTASPAVVDEGVVYVERGGNRVMALLSTGSLTAPWRLVDISRQASHLINSPTSLAVTNGNTQAAERYVMVLNADGSVAVLFFDEAPARIGWTSWDTNGGRYTSMTLVNGFLVTNCNRTIGAATVSFLERFDADTQLDCSRPFSDAASMLDIKGETVSIINGTAYLGDFHVNNDGTVDGLAFNANYDAGFHFTMDSQLWSPEPEGDVRPSFAKRHIGRVSVRVQDTQSFQFGVLPNKQVTIPVYKSFDDPNQPPPLRSRWERRGFLGWQEEPNVYIRRPIPQPVEVLAVSQEVAF